MKFQEYKTHLTKLLKSKENLLDTEGEVLIDRVIKLAQKYDNDLLQLLWNDEETRGKFFEEIGEISVFKERDFCFYIEERRLDNTYTNYENRIGLSTGRYKLSDIDDVVLNFPYKDCVLEGGQSTEEGLDTFYEFDEESNDYVEKGSNRKEIFFNQILAKNELDRLKEPKAFVNVKKYSQKGEEEITAFNRNAEGHITDNLIVKGNNLLAMYSLLEEFKGRIKLIYIDPPYNTGSDSFKYNDNFNHSTWLTFMKNRLELASKLLTDDGVIFVQCDDNEQAYLKVLMDDVLHDFIFVNNISVKMSEVSGTKMSHVDKRFLKIKENILFYRKDNASVSYNPIKIHKAEWDSEYNKIFSNLTKENKAFIDSVVAKEYIDDTDLIAIDTLFENIVVKSVNEQIKDENVPNEQVNDWMIENSYRIFRTAASSSVKVLSDEKKEQLNQVYFSVLSKRDKLLYIVKSDYSSESRQPRVQILFAEDYLTTYVGDLWTDITTTGLEAEGAVKLKNGKKPEAILNRILSFCTKPNDIVLDFHLGSGTTASVAHKMKRQYLGVEQIDNQIELVISRLNNVIQGDQTGISKIVDWQTGGEFIYLELAKFNQEAVNTILKAKTLDELQSFFEEMADKFFLDYNVRVHEFKSVIMHEENFKYLSLDRQKEIFIKMLDLNQLYVNVSDMEDSEYNLTANDIKLTKDFYRLNDN